MAPKRVFEVRLSVGASAKLFSARGDGFSPAREGLVDRRWGRTLTVDGDLCRPFDLCQLESELIFEVCCEEKKDEAKDTMMKGRRKEGRNGSGGRV